MLSTYRLEEAIGGDEPDGKGTNAQAVGRQTSTMSAGGPLAIRHPSSLLKKIACDVQWVPCEVHRGGDNPDSSHHAAAAESGVLLQAYAGQAAESGDDGGREGRYLAKHHRHLAP